MYGLPEGGVRGKDYCLRVVLFAFKMSFKVFLLLSCTVSKLRDDKALVLHIAETNQVPSFFAARPLSISPCFLSAIEEKAVAVVGNPWA